VKSENDRTTQFMASERVSTLELFFDLVFVFTITQVARLVSNAHGGGDLGAAALILIIAWWMYGGYAWLTNNVGTSGLSLRLLMLLGMGAYFVMALSIPRASNEDGLPFGLAFALVTVVHAVLFTRAANSSATAILQIAPFNFLAAGCTVGAAFIEPGWRWAGWLGAVAVFLASTLWRRERGFQVGAAHFAERHGLVIIVAIGESVVSLGSGIDAIAVRWPLIRVVSLGFALCAAIWWSYFDGDDERGEHALRSAPASGRARLALMAYSYAHLGMVAGIVGIAAGLHDAIASLGGPISASHAWVLAGGVALYLLSDKWFRSLLAIGASHWRGAAALLALATAPAGSSVSSTLQIAALVAILVAMLVVENRTSRRALASPTVHAT
jgi:low temperature requirement protein LtrA